MALDFITCETGHLARRSIASVALSPPPILCEIEATGVPRGGVAASFKIRDQQSTTVFDPATGLTQYTAVSWNVGVSYWNGSAFVETVIPQPYGDPLFNLYLGQEHPRTNWGTHTWILQVRTSTYDTVGDTFAADGTVQLLVDGSAVLSLSGITVARYCSSKNMTVRVGCGGDIENVYLTQNGLLVFYDNLGGGRANWQDWDQLGGFPGTPFMVPMPSVFNVGITGSPTTSYMYAGLERLASGPPPPAHTPPPPNPPPPPLPPEECPCLPGAPGGPGGPGPMGPPGPRGPGGGGGTPPGGPGGPPPGGPGWTPPAEGWTSQCTSTGGLPRSYTTVAPSEVFEGVIETQFWLDVATLN